MVLIWSFLILKKTVVDGQTIPLNNLLAEQVLNKVVNHLTDSTLIKQVFFNHLRYIRLNLSCLQGY